MPLSASLEQQELSVDPGGYVRTEVRIANPGPAAERARLEVRGAAAEWAYAIPPELEVPAGGEAVASFNVRVPRGPEPAAGRHRFELVVSGSGEAVTVAGTVTVTAFRELALEVEPAGARDARRVTVSNRGNVATRATLSASGDEGVEVDITPDVVTADPGEDAAASLRVRAGGRPLLGTRSRSFAVTATTDDEGGEARSVTATGSLAQRPVLAGRPLAAGVVALVVLLVAAALVAGGGNDKGSSVTASDTTTAPSPSGSGGTGEGGSGCVVDGHADPRVTGLEPDDIPTLPGDFSFFGIASDGCHPVRWNPCEPIHYVINPANATPTGVADVKEAFRRLAEVTGMEYVDDGITDETAERGREAHQPERYGERWAPILVHWQNTTRGTADIQIVGGGFPTRAGDVYVTGNLFLNPYVVTNPQTRTTVAGGFGNDEGAGPIGPEGVTWGRVILHELAHITGLGHTRDPAQLMYPETTAHTTRPVRFERGDLAGLEHLGRKAGCLTTPPLDTPTGSARGTGQRAPTQGASAPQLSPSNSTP